MKKYFLLFFIITSCSSTNFKTFLTEETWMIEEMNYKNKNIEPLLFSNIITFGKDNKCEIPIIKQKGKLIDKKDREGSWNMTSNKLEIKSLRDYLNGEFDICFGKDLIKKRVYIIIESENLYLRAYKGHFGNGFNEKLPINCSGKGTD